MPVVDTSDPGVKHHGPRVVRVDHSPKGQCGHRLRGPGTNHSNVQQGNGTGLAQSHRASDAARVPRGDTPTALGGAGHGPLLVGIADGWTGGFHGQKVVRAGTGRPCDLQQMRDERTLSRPQVRAVQPHVALHGDPGEL